MENVCKICGNPELLVPTSNEYTYFVPSYIRAYLVSLNSKKKKKKKEKQK